MQKAKYASNPTLDKISQCIRCKNDIGNGACKAFPDGIPMQILKNEWDHREEFPGDNGIQFEEEE